jgi:hypothetical protein
LPQIENITQNGTNHYIAINSQVPTPYKIKSCRKCKAAGGREPVAQSAQQRVEQGNNEHYTKRE